MLGVHYEIMNDLRMITFRCDHPLYNRMEGFGGNYELDRTSVLKLALHFFLNHAP